jgi:hypothetical protein
MDEATEKYREEHSGGRIILKQKRKDQTRKGTPEATARTSAETADIWLQLGATTEVLAARDTLPADDQSARTRLLKGYLEKEELQVITKSKVTSEDQVIEAGSKAASKVMTGRNEVKQLMLLVTQGADVNVRGGPHEQTALHLAVRSRSPDLIEALIKFGAETGIGDKDGKTPLNLAIELFEREEDPGKKEIFKKIIKQLDPKYILTPPKQNIGSQQNPKSGKHRHQSKTGKVQSKHRCPAQTQTSVQDGQSPEQIQTDGESLKHKHRHRRPTESQTQQTQTPVQDGQSPERPV